MSPSIAKVLTLVKGGRPIKVAILETYQHLNEYYRQVTEVERKVIYMARQEFLVTQRQLVGKKNSSGLFVQMPDELKRKVYELALISKTDSNQLVRALLRKAIEEAGIN